MLKSIARLPFRLAKVIARKIQEEDAEFYEKHKAQYESRGKVARERIPEHELADLPPEEVMIHPLRARDLKPFWVDVRDASSWGDERIAGAEHMRAVDLMIRLAELPSDEPLVCYCDDGSEALTATLFLRRRGFHQAWALNGGLKAWKKSGAPTES